jgi:membrane-bound ClpP family serine protease
MRAKVLCGRSNKDVMKLRIVVLMVALALGIGGLAARGAEVGLIRIQGAIGPATASYVARAIRVAAEDHDTCLIIHNLKSCSF